MKAEIKLKCDKFLLLIKKVMLLTKVKVLFKKNDSA